MGSHTSCRAYYDNTVPRLVHVFVPCNAATPADAAGLQLSNSLSKWEKGEGRPP